MKNFVLNCQAFLLTNKNIIVSTYKNEKKIYKFKISNVNNTKRDNIFEKLYNI